MRKCSPWLEIESEAGGVPHREWIEPPAGRFPLWVCSAELAKYWCVGRFDFIQIWGDTSEPRWDTYPARPASPEDSDAAADLVWTWSPDRAYRFDNYANFLERFRAPVVHVWIEGTRWVSG